MRLEFNELVARLEAWVVILTSGDRCGLLVFRGQSKTMETSSRLVETSLKVGDFIFNGLIYSRCIYSHWKPCECQDEQTVG